MNTLTTFIILLGISFSTSNYSTLAPQELTTVEQPEIIKGFVVNHNRYTLHFDLEKKMNQEFSLVIYVELYNGSHYISPNTKGDFPGKLFMDLGSYTNLEFKGKLSESPLSVEEFIKDPSTNRPINWVRINTTYKQDLKLKTQEDFEVFGRLQFTVEPNCTYVQTPFSLSYKNGVMTLTTPEC